jgi:NOL1/NOP2/fmu family ribosome biogenesis protein
MLCENMVRWGSTNVLVSSNQAIDFQRLPNYFDLIVADVPCSGSGLFRKDPTAKDEWSLEQVQQCAIRQEKIMTEVLPCLTENGILIYSTCSYSQEENEYMTDFLIRSFGMETVDIDIPTAWGIQKTVSSEGGIGFRFYPDQLTGEGFFICVLRLPKQVIGTNPMHRFPTKLNRMPEMDTEQVRPFLSNANNCTLYTKEEKIWMLPAELSQELDLLSQVLLLKLPGIEVGQMKGMHFVPAHALAMSGTYDQGTPVGALRLEDALRYLRKSDLPVDAFPDGWSLVSYADVILGWIKKIPHRINNYYPMGYRLRK